MVHVLLFIAADEYGRITGESNSEVCNGVD